jgi:hypothetical protein
MKFGANMKSQRVGVQITAVVFGAIVCLALGTLFLTIGSTVYFSKATHSFAAPSSLVVAGIAALSGISLMSGIGGYTASHVASQSGLRQPLLMGFLSWALALALISYPINTQISALIQVVSQEILGSVVATSEMNLGLRNLRNVRPQVTSDVKILKGKVNTQLNLNDPNKVITPQLGRIIFEEMNSLPEQHKLRADYADAAHRMARLIVIGDGLLSLALIWSLVVSMIGGVIAVRRRPLATESEPEPENPMLPSPRLAHGI